MPGSGQADSATADTDLAGWPPVDRPSRFSGLDVEILPEIEHRLGFQLQSASRVIPRDHVSVVVGLREAGELIASKQAACVIVAAVDSLQHDLKNHYLSERRLLTPQTPTVFRWVRPVARSW